MHVHESLIRLCVGLWGVGTERSYPIAWSAAGDNLIFQHFPFVSL